MADLIEKLKKNRLPFKYCTDKEQEVFRKAGGSKCLVLSSEGTCWSGCT